MNEHQLLTRVQEARQAFGARCLKLAGSLAVEVIRNALMDLGIAVSERDVFIQGVPVEIDLLVAGPTATAKCRIIYQASDGVAAFEVKNSGAYPGTIESVRKSFELIRSANPRIYCAYVTLAERRGYKYAATRENLGEDVYTLFWHNGSTKHRLYDSTGDWDKLIGRVKGLYAS